jgi:hypothetical protein
MSISLLPTPSQLSPSKCTAKPVYLFLGWCTESADLNHDDTKCAKCFRVVHTTGLTCGRKVHIANHDHVFNETAHVHTTRDSDKVTCAPCLSRLQSTFALVA